MRTTPLQPTHCETQEPHVVANSSTLLPIFELSFPSSIEDKTSKPVYAQCNIKVCRMLGKIGLTFDDAILNLDSDEGSWIQDNLDPKL